MPDLTPRQIVDRLGERGWNPQARRLGATTWHAGSKAYATGTAIVYVRTDGHLSAEYWSEGRNVLSALYVLPTDRTPAAVDAFLLAIEAAVDASYAARVRRCASIPTEG